jgi:L-amino acid N-acyltransferase
MVSIRAMTIHDLTSVVGIYNASIFTSTTWSDNPQTVEQRAAWFAQRAANGDGTFVADDGEVVGFAAYGEFRDNAVWPGYRFTVENSVHVHADHHGRGIGCSLMTALIHHAASAGKHVMIAAVDGDNVGSITFHERLGFTEVGRLPQTGWKFDRWLDLVLLQRSLDSKP